MTMRELDLTARPDQADVAIWVAFARKMLGASPDTLKSLISGIAVKPLATRKDWPQPDGSGLPGSAPFRRGARREGERGWDICQHHARADLAAANEDILDDLAGGAIALWLKIPDGGGGLRIASASDFARVLNGVSTKDLKLILDAGANAGTIARQFAEYDKDGATSTFLNHDIFALVAQGRLSPAEVNNEIDATAALAREFSAERPAWRAIGVDTRPYHNAGAMPTQELAIALAIGLAQLRTLTDAGLDLETAARQIAFTLVTDGELVQSIAKLRAFRRAWGCVLESCGAGDAMNSLHITAMTSERILTRRDPHTNILRTTSACAAAALGGADMICALPFTMRVAADSSEARRIARAIQLILLEESHLAEVCDPAGGSFSIESLSEVFAETAWQEFQEIERRSGMAKALASGFIGERIEESWTARQKAIACRREWITGVSDFPLLSEVPAQSFASEPSFNAERTVTHQTGVGALPRHFLDEDFEALRAASDAIFAESGSRPRLYIVGIESEADYGLRVSFARALFESGGIEIEIAEVSTGAEDAAANFLESGIRMAAIASSDEIYAQNSLSFCHAIKSAGARYLYLVGKPGLLEAQLRAAGVDEFVHNGIDAIETLRRAYDILGRRL